MSLSDLDAYTLINDSGNVQYFKDVAESLAQMQQRVKQQMDRGLAPDDFAKAEVASHALYQAEGIIQALQD